MLNHYAARRHADGVLGVTDQAEVDRLIEALGADWPLIRRALLLDLALLNPAIGMVMQAVGEEWDRTILRDWLAPGAGSRDMLDYPQTQ